MYHEEERFVITNPHWFCHDIMGEFLHRCANLDSKLEMVSIHGMISIEHARRIILDIIGGQGHEDFVGEILSMMKKLHICYEHDDKDIMIPSLLGIKCERLSWLAMVESVKLRYVGRRLSCKDSKRIMLTLGFFPRLQVSFFKKFQKNNVGNSYQLFGDVIMFIFDGIEVIIEYAHDEVDILLRSEQCQDKMLEFLENGIVRHIQDLLMNPTLGCLGVILVEHILRPKCVEELVEAKVRKDQFVSVKELELEVVIGGFDATHNWKQCRQLRTGYDKVKNLLGLKAWENLLKRRCEDLQRYEGQILHTSSGKDSHSCEKKMKSKWRSSVWKIPQRLVDLATREVNDKLDNINQKLDVVIRKVDDIVHMQQDILKMQDNLLYEVSSRINDLMELSIKMQQSQVPKLAYLSEVGKKKLLTRFVPGLMESELHLMCESGDGIHEVVDQQGCKVTFGTNGTRTFVTMLVWGLKMATILTKIGAHVSGGMGHMLVAEWVEWFQILVKAYN